MQSIPEPQPSKGQVKVPEKLITWLIDNQQDPKCITLIQERDNFGFKKYGTHLETFNGRNCIEDLRQELGDALQYTMQAKLEGKALGEIKVYVQALCRLIDE